jgi:hypothetical protein
MHPLGQCIRWVNASVGSIHPLVTFIRWVVFPHRSYDNGHTTNTSLLALDDTGSVRIHGIRFGSEQYNDAWYSVRVEAP